MKMSEETAWETFLEGLNAFTEDCFQDNRINEKTGDQYTADTENTIKFVTQS